MTKKLTFKQWLEHIYNLKFEVYMETDSDFKDQCRQGYVAYIKKVTGGEVSV